MPLQHAQKQGRKFINSIPTSQGLENGLLKTTLQFLFEKGEREPKRALGPFKTDVSIYNKTSETGLRITWLGHSGILIEIDGHTLLTDPVYGRASFSQSFGPKRFFAAPIDIDKIPKLDAIILSHDHYDHLDKEVMKQLGRRGTPFYCSLGVGEHLQRWGISSNLIHEMDWTDTMQVKDLQITATPARHFSGRGITNRNETLWSSFVIKGKHHNIFFGADSGWFPGFKDIGDAYGPFDLTMLEVGAYGDGWPDIHMGPENAVKAHIDLKGKIMMPIHWGTYSLALHAWYEPAIRVQKAANDNKVKLFMPIPGEPTAVNNEALVSGWWQ